MITFRNVRPAAIGRFHVVPSYVPHMFWVIGRFDSKRSTGIGRRVRAVFVAMTCTCFFQRHVLTEFEQKECCSYMNLFLCQILLKHLLKTFFNSL